MVVKQILKNLPEVQPPAEKKLDFKVKAKWTLIILGSFFILANIPLYGLSGNSLSRFENLAVLLGTDFGSIISLGIGPIVTASIILQLLVGSKIINIDTSTSEGKRYFQGIQKLMVIFFVIFEACIFVIMKGLEATPGYAWVVITQLILGGVAIMLMDEVSNKWGFGSGVSLFIAAGVSWRLFTSLFQFIGPEGNLAPSGQLLVLINSIINSNTIGATIAASAIISTIVVFLVIVWAQSLKVEIPLSFDRLRGYAIKWPLAFFYTSVMPVILVSALAANIQLAAGLLENWLGRATILGGFQGGIPVSGFSLWINSSNLLQAAITGSFTTIMIWQSIFHILFYVVFSVLFAFFWVKTSGMDAQTQAKNIMNSGLTIPGFRKDERILESVLERYILPLTIMGGIAIGLLAAVSNLVGTLIQGTSFLLVIMIMYQYYQQIAQQHSMDMTPALKKFIK
ncbi:preprotein translocase subunit SecY [Candidatus Pacearchaeota archaeon]|nr:preprotein translocase subunit SecY [Candidatus Pacearchaeota archaeon]